MRWLLNLSTRSKLFLGFGLMAIFLATVILTAYTHIAAIQRSQKDLFEEDFFPALNFMRLRSNLNGQRAALLQMMLAVERSEREAWHQEIKERSKENEEIMQRLLQRNWDDPKIPRRIEELNTLENGFKQTRDTQIFPLIDAGKIEEAKRFIRGIQVEQYQKIRSMVRELGDGEVKHAQSRIAQSTQEAENSVRVFIAVGILALLMSVTIVVFLNRIIARPLQEISGMIGRVASGDLTVAVPLKHRADEVGTLVQTCGRMVESLRGMTREIQEGVNVLAASASEIMASTAQVASSAAEGATAVSETTTTIEEVRQTAQVSAQKASVVSESAQRAAQVSQNGRKSVEDSLEGMNRIQEQMESIAECIVRLSEQGQAVGEIIATVNDLAEQSRLLAVNASIEAAKAGEQGKGFAVVAQEVKDLAEQSKQATAQVRAILGDIQKATSAAVMATEQGSKAVEAGVGRSVEVGQAIRTLADSLAESAQAAIQIAASSQQQMLGMDQVALAMENIKQASAQNVASTRQSEAAAQNLHELGQKLKQLLGQYRV